MVTTADANALNKLTDAVKQATRRIVGVEVDVQASWIEEYPNQPEVLVEVTLPRPRGSEWEQSKTAKIRTAVREETARHLPRAVATTRLVIPDA